MSASVAENGELPETSNLGVQIGIDGIDNSRSNENGSGLVEGDDNGSAFALNSITEESEPLNNDSVFVSTGLVQDARLKFLDSDDIHESANLSSSEKSSNSSKKTGNVDDNDIRNVPVMMDMNEKSWLISTARGDMIAMRRLLDVDTDLADKKNGIHWAAKKGNVDMLKMVLEHNADVNLKTGYTPLHLATMGGHEQCISLLLDYGADVNARDYSGRKPINYLREPESYEYEFDEQIPRWQRHFLTGTKYVPLVSDDVYERIEIKMLTSKMDNDLVRRRQSESAVSLVNISDGKQRSKSTVFHDRKNSQGDAGSKVAKLLRKDSSSRGLWKKPSIRKHKSRSVSTIEHPISTGAPQALPHLSSGLSWKPAGPKT